VIVAGRVSQKREIARSGKGDVLRCGGFLFVIGRIEGRCPLELPRQGIRSPAPAMFKREHCGIYQLVHE
jgi:hypothetical protein